MKSMASWAELTLMMGRMGPKISSCITLSSRGTSDIMVKSMYLLLRSYFPPENQIHWAFCQIVLFMDWVLMILFRMVYFRKTIVKKLKNTSIRISIVHSWYFRLKIKRWCWHQSRFGLLQKNATYSSLLTLFYLIKWKWRHCRKIWQ